VNTPSLGGPFYFLIFVDDFSQYTHVYFLQKKLVVCLLSYTINLCLKNIPIKRFLYTIQIMEASSLSIDLINTIEMKAFKDSLQIHTIWLKTAQKGKIGH